jgi:hypothetical protein
MQTEPKSSGCPTPVEPIFESRAVYIEKQGFKMSRQSILSVGATQLLDAVSFSADVRTAIEECISLYGSPFKVQNIAFRVLSPVKGWFGYSEWEMTIRKVIKYDNLPNDPELKQALYEIADSFLRLVLRYHRDNITEMPDKVLEIFKEPSSSENKGDLVFSPQEAQKLPSEWRYFVKTLKKHLPPLAPYADIHVSYNIR